ncbi:hypothetical protein SNK03_000348 [Fusarium graminearum]
MSHLSTDAIVTIISTIPGLLVSSLSAWFAYAAIRRRRPAASDIETSTIGLIMVPLGHSSLTAPSTARQLPPVPAVPQLANTNSPSSSGQPRRQLDRVLQ